MLETKGGDFDVDSLMFDAATAETIEDRDCDLHRPDIPLRATLAWLAALWLVYGMFYRVAVGFEKKKL